MPHVGEDILQNNLLFKITGGVPNMHEIFLQRIWIIAFSQWPCSRLNILKCTWGLVICVE